MNRFIKGGVIVLFLTLGLFSTALAADLNWVNDTNVIINGQTYIISASSVATTFEVGATTATVTVPSGGTFVFRSADAFKLTTNNSVSQTCTNSASTLSIKGPKTVIITPDATKQCSGLSSGGGGGGGGGTSSSSHSVATPVVVPVTTPVAPTADCKLGYKFNPITGLPCTTFESVPVKDTPATPASPTSSTCKATVVLKLNVSNEEVKCLQKYLNSHGFALATTGVGSLGFETTKFGKLTKVALMKFQASKGLTPDGVFGPKTAAQMTP